MNSSKKIYRVLLFFVALFVAMPVLAQDFNFGETLRNFGEETGFAQMFATEGGWKTLITFSIVGNYFPDLSVASCNRLGKFAVFISQNDG